MLGTTPTPSIKNEARAVGERLTGGPKKEVRDTANVTPSTGRMQTHPKFRLEIYPSGQKKMYTMRNGILRWVPLPSFHMDTNEHMMPKWIAVLENP
jgi:hypothetical protein